MRFPFLTCVLLCLPTATSAQPASNRQPPVPWLALCAPRGVATAWCGTFDVPEDRADRGGRRIGLRVVVLPALENDPEPDPVVYLMGGPGGPATAIAGSLGQWHALRYDRDIVLVDQRGTGGSNPLTCTEPADDAPLQAFFREMFPPDYVQACLAGLADRANVRLYTTPVAADDLDELRAALGYERVNLLGGSYGTRAALIYMRRHPTRVRAAILEGVAPVDMKNPLPFSRALDRALEATFDACAAEPSCAAAYPDLRVEWGRVVERFAAGAVTADVTDPRTDAPVRLTIPKGVFTDGVRHILYTVEDARLLPHVIRRAAAGDFDPFVAMELEQAIGYANLISFGMFLTVTCAEDVQFITEAEVARETADTFLGDYRVRRQQAACAHWPAAAIDASYMEPVQAEVPVLILSGAVDPATPWEGGAAVAEQLPDATHLLVPNQAHGNANPPCRAGIIEAFLRAGTMDGIDTTCVAATKRRPFEVFRP